eukprot:jgi/Botrbrau1/18473/Bobra.0072s0055.1
MIYRDGVNVAEVDKQRRNSIPLSLLSLIFNIVSFGCKAFRIVGMVLPVGSCVSQFRGVHLARRQVVSQRTGGISLHQRCRRPILSICMSSSIQFIKGVDEPSVPDVSLTRSRDGSSGVATFVFTQPSVFEASNELGDITGLYLIDDEGTLQTVDVQAKFVNGKPDRIEAKYVMRSAFEWDRFMRFMERYADDHQLGFTAKE